jgi:hypothetical protein
MLVAMIMPLYPPLMSGEQKGAKEVGKCTSKRDHLISPYFIHSASYNSASHIFITSKAKTQKEVCNGFKYF